MKPPDERYTIGCDFDGVLHQYVSPWVNASTIPDPPMPGAIGWLYEMIQKFEVVIFTTRGRTARGRRAIRKWLRKHCGDLLWYESPDGLRGLEEIEITATKPTALIYIDDRAYRFEGTFPTAQEIHNARPWKFAKGLT